MWYTRGSYIYVRIFWTEIDAHAKNIVSDVSGVHPTHQPFLYGVPVFVLCIQICSICIRQVSFMDTQQGFQYTQNTQFRYAGTMYLNRK